MAEYINYPSQQRGGFWRNVWQVGLARTLNYGVRAQISAAVQTALQREVATGFGVKHPVTPQQLEANRGYVYAVVQRAGGMAARVQPILELHQRVGRGQPATKSQVHDHSFLDLLRQPNVDENGAEFMWKAIGQLQTAGRIYLLIEPKKFEYYLPGADIRVRDQGIASMRLLEPDRVLPIAQELDGQVVRWGAYYQYTPPKGTRLIYPGPPATHAERENWKSDPHPFVFRIVMPSVDSYDGQSPTQAADNAINILQGLNKLHQNQLYNGIHSGMIFYLLQNVTSVERFVEGVLMVRQGLGKAGEPLILPKGTVEVEKSPMSNSEMLLGDLKKEALRELLSVMGASEGLLGMTDNVNRCHDAQTECLTDMGWVRQEDIGPDTLVAAFDPITGTIRYERPVAIHREEYDGPMLHFASPLTGGVAGRRAHRRGGVDLFVTPNHRMYVRRRPDRAGWQTLEASELVGWVPRSWMVRAAAPSVGLDGAVLPVVLPGHGDGWRTRAGHDVVVDPEVWASLLGWLVAEGHWYVRGTRSSVSLSQSLDRNPDKVAAIDALLERFPIRASRHVGCDRTVRWQWHHRGFAEHLLQNCGRKAPTKRLPGYAKQWPAPLLRLLLDTALAGDGRVHAVKRHHSWQFSVTSEHLADDIQEIAVKAGLRAVRRPGDKSSKRNGRHHDMHAVCVSTNVDQQLPVPVEVQYRGTVWCVQTTTGYFVTRRNGCVALQGNSVIEGLERQFAQGNLDPKLALMAAGFNEWVLPLYHGQSYSARYKVRYPSSAAADELTVMDRLSKGVSSSIYTPNEARAELGLKPHADGDKLIIGLKLDELAQKSDIAEQSMALQEEALELKASSDAAMLAIKAMDGAGSSDLTNPEGPKKQNPKATQLSDTKLSGGIQKPKSNTAKLGGGRYVRAGLHAEHPLFGVPARASRWREAMRLRAPAEVELRRRLGDVLLRWRGELTSQLEHGAPAGRSAEGSGRWATTIAQATRAWALAVAVHAGRQALKRQGLDAELLDARDPDLVAWADRRAIRFGDAAATMLRQDLEDALLGAPQDRLTVEQTVALVAELFPTANSALTRRIVAGETTAASGAGVAAAALIAEAAIQDAIQDTMLDTTAEEDGRSSRSETREDALEFGGVFAFGEDRAEEGASHYGLLWIAPPDLRQGCLSHRDIDGEVVMVGARFRVAGREMAYPGEDTGEEQMALDGCRCHTELVRLEAS